MFYIACLLGDALHAKDQLPVEAVAGCSWKPRAGDTRPGVNNAASHSDNHTAALKPEVLLGTPAAEATAAQHVPHLRVCLRPPDRLMHVPAPSTFACAATAGAERYVHVYFPPSYDGTSQWPIWVHLHGVFWATMGDIGKQVSILQGLLRVWRLHWQQQSSGSNDSNGSNGGD